METNLTRKECKDRNAKHFAFRQPHTKQTSAECFNVHTHLHCCACLSERSVAHLQMLPRVANSQNAWTTQTSQSNNEMHSAWKQKHLTRLFLQPKTLLRESTNRSNISAPIQLRPRWRVARKPDTCLDPIRFSVSTKTHPLSVGANTTSA